MSRAIPSECNENIQLCNRCNHSYSISFQIPDKASLRTGCLPTTIGARLICDAIAEADDHIEEIGHELERLNESLKRLDTLKRSLEYSQDVRRALVAPVRRLPTEILAEIFKACCGDAICIAIERCAPLELGSVCKVWRDTIVGMPTLWAGFFFSYDLHRCYAPPASLVTRLKTFLENSGDVPLRHCIGEQGWSLESLSGDLFEAILQHSHRWTCLWVCPPPRTSIVNRDSLFSQLEGRSLSRLTSLQGSHNDLCEGNESNLFHIPTLRSLLILFERGSDARIMPNLPWEQLECLYIDGPPHYSYDILRRCPNVVEWNYSNKWCCTSPATIPETAIRLSHLRKLSVDITQETADAALLGRLEAPSVESLALDWDISPQSLLSESYLGRLVERFSRRLRCLRLIGFQPIGRSCLSSLPDLHTLEIGYFFPSFNQDWLDDLSAVDDAGSPRILPRLQIMKIEDPLSFPPAALVEMLEARRAMGHGLERLMLHRDVVEDSSEWNDDVTARLRSLVPSFEIFI
ncbi:uncharacterized protein SCHCODRAFT_02592432 [Schizophyllum commune H4-8]|uniref:uncharacterized protein n=1 Tax=Schizophyllum commune (strain H4-8 / FGSC 9210) TaxID=578458 RepID=UPI00215F8C00|nr:uncharacterized protein SCHCODRAFT_02592432 [Schizophyllum commune H4-8]KAI5885895.1 hypothetical protein SCHCODRAFT_02592432 [Schizophyllum commune H4-8]